MTTVQTNTDEPPRPFYTFPPFPTPPPGVTITPFTAFKEPGIVIQIDANEVDGRGVPTLTLNSRHDLTLEEKKMGKKRLANATQVTADGSVRRIAWHEEWRSHERAHHFSYDPASSEFDRLWQASWDFKNSRAWPPTTNPLLNLWDQIRLYIGLITSIQPPPSKRKKGGQAPVAQADDDEDNEDEYVNVKEEVPVERVDDPQEGLKIAQERNKAAAKDTNSSKPPLDDAARELMREQRDAKKDQRMQEFLHETENTIKIFFSAHWRDKGLAWDKARSEQCPLLLGFFLRFLLFVNAFPEPDIQRGLQRALKVVERAEVELPATFVVAKTLEDGVSKGFRQMWGNMTNTLKLWDDDEEEEKEVDSDKDEGFPKAQDVTVVEVAEGEEAADLDDNSPANAKKRKLESGEAVPTSTTTNDDEDKDTIVINSNDMSVDVDVDTAALKDSIADNVDINGVEVAPTDGWASGWGSTWGATNNTTNDGGEWGSTTNDGGGWGAERSGSPTPVVDEAWKIEEDTTLRRLLGEETVRVLGEGYTTGVVERSTRRVVGVVKPSSEASSKSKPTKNTGKEAGSTKPESVENELENKLAHIVLAPWKKVGNHIGSDVTLPVLQRHSRGHEGFDPTKEEIMVLLDPASVEKIPVGVGLTATWVQLARRAGDDDDEGDGTGKGKGKGGEKREKKGAKGRNGEGTRWWYMEQFMATLTSFHTDRYYPDQD